ncbi:hypothetical protein ACQJBY_070307 [Aegilops geniculata]
MITYFVKLPAYPVRRSSNKDHILLFLSVVMPAAIVFLHYILAFMMQGIITAPMLYAMEEFPQLQDVVDQGFDNPANVEIALDYLQKSRGIERTKELAQEHVNLAVKAIESLPDSDDEDVLISRRALIDITQRVITRTK